MYDKEKELWITSLKSGDYLKSKLWLKLKENDKEYFSMMGVFCELFKSLLKSDWIESPYDDKFYYFLGQTQVFPKILTDKLHITPKEYSAIIDCQQRFKDNPDFNKEANFLENLK